MLKFIRCAVVALMLALGAGAAQDYAPPLSELRPLAEQGNGLAQFAPGLLYAKGQGVTQNYR